MNKDETTQKKLRDIYYYGKDSGLPRAYTARILGKYTLLKDKDGRIEVQLTHRYKRVRLLKETEENKLKEPYNAN